MKRLLPCLALLALAGCLTRPQGLAYRRLGVVAASDASGSPAPGFEPSCTTLPVLLGSVVDETHAVAPPLALEIFATWDGAELVFHGAAADAGADQRIDAATLSDPTWTGSVSVPRTDGTSFTVQLAATCSAP